MIKLEELKLKDINIILKWLEDGKWEEARVLMGPSIYGPLTILDLENDFFTYKNEDEHFYKIIKEESGDVIGVIGLNEMNLPKKSGWIHKFLIEKDQRGLGYGKKALTILIKIGKTKFSMEKFELLVLQENKRAKSLYKGIGFKESKVYCLNESGEKVIEMVY